MEAILGILAFMVAILAVLQGWQMLSKKRNNPGYGEKLDVIIEKLGILDTMEQRLDDIWTKINRE